MSVTLDHTVVTVKDIPATIKFYTDILGFKYDGHVAHFEVIRVNEGLTLDLVEGDAEPTHYAFEMDRKTFHATFQRIKKSGIPYGGSPRGTDMKAPGRSVGARGRAEAVYFCDPSDHSLEIRCYEKRENRS